ncbi:hypothetical protein GIB67_012680 [Kingdonia uniflora]|uniref:Uncharacterized protein n=1 Tax=Kingdonia uniflora TaxID=39325 RepID=A0A7J7NFE0_9MAGN|nr:hypothetical protein GIB67_012680 [Kingdonia uniflora]
MSYEDIMIGDSLVKCAAWLYIQPKMEPQKLRRKCSFRESSLMGCFSIIKHIFSVTSEEGTGKGLSTTKDTGSGKRLSTTKVGGLLCHNSFPDPEPEYRGYPRANDRGLDPRRYGVAYTNHVKSWNNAIVKVRYFPIYVFIEELHKICLEMSYTYREEAEMSQARLTPWAMDHYEIKKFVADSLTCRVCTVRHHFQMTSYGKTNLVNIEDDTCSYRWWQTMGIPYEHGVCALGLANVDPTTRVSEYFTNNTYKVVYKLIWIPIRGIKQLKILKTDPCVRVPIPTVRAGHPHT